MDEWIRAHVVDVPVRTRDFCGDILRGARVLDVGCGDMLIAAGLLTLDPAQVTGLDIHAEIEGWRPRLADRVRGNGHALDDDRIARLGYAAYNGTDFPFDDGSFDVAFSWGVFEHVADVAAVLREMNRVLTPEGRAFVVVEPWYLSEGGSHLTDYVAQPWFHLLQRDSWVKARLEAHVDRHGGDRSFVTGYLYDEYRTLNRISVSDFYRAARAAGFVAERARLLARDEDLSRAPDGVDFPDLMIRGTMMLMRPGGAFEVPAPADRR